MIGPQTERASTPWIDACSTDEIDEEDVMRWDHGGKTYALYHSPDGEFFCTHKHVHSRQREVATSFFSTISKTSRPAARP